jgi:hypothetical protein
VQPGHEDERDLSTKGLRTKQVWIYDGRTNVASATKKDRSLMAEPFGEFEKRHPGLARSAPPGLSRWTE